MILGLAWKNIWRQRVRSLVLIVSTAIGVWSLVFLLSWVFGIVHSFIGQSIDLRLGHIQVHHEEYADDFSQPKTFDLQEVKSSIPSEKYIASPRLITQAIAKSSRSTQGVVLKGVDPILDSLTLDVHKEVVEGSFFREKARNPMVISSTLAAKLKVKMNSKVVAQFQDKSGELVSAAFRIKGIYDSGDPKLDRLIAFVHIEDLRRLLDLEENEIHEWVVFLPDIDDVEKRVSQWRSKLFPLKVQTYAEISPDIQLFSTQIHLNVIIMTVIFMLALVFGIINTMLMAVLERIKELGMLMAIGMNKVRVFLMIVAETVMLTMVGVPFGLFLGWATIRYLRVDGINLSNWSEGLRQFGLSHIVRPELDLGYYVFVAFAVALTAFLAAIYPAYKAVQLQPVEALRKI